MCYEALVDGDATAKSLRTVVRDERRDALGNGLETAALVAAVLLWQGVGLALAVGVAAAAVGIGYAVHQVVLVVGVAAVRLLGDPDGRGLGLSFRNY